VERRSFRLPAFRLPASRRTTAGVAALVTAALGVGLLAPDWGEPQSAAPKKSEAAGPLSEDAAQEKAVAGGKPVEVTSLRSETSTTYAKPDGSFELTVSGAPVRAKVNGVWKPIDTELVKVKGGFAPKAAADPVVFSAGSGTRTTKKSAATANQAVYTTRTANTGGARVLRAADADDTYTALATLTSGEHTVTLSWPGELPEPVISGASALYRNVFSGVDLLMTARDSGFSHVLIVHNAQSAADPALAKLSYGLSSPDLTFHLDPSTSVVTGEDSAGNEIAVSPTPYMWDSAGTLAVTEGEDPEPAEPSDDPTPTYSEEPGAPATDLPGEGDDTEANADTAAYRNAAATDDTPTDDEVLALKGLAGPDPGTHAAVAKAALSNPGTTSGVLSIVPDADLLADEDTQYPVFIDPTIYGKTKNWTTAYNRYPSSSFYDGANYNTGTTEARVGFESTTWGKSRSFFKLGWSTSIKGATVSSANIKLLETYAWSCSDRSVELWYTGGISSKTTWNNQPDWKSKIGAKSFAHGYNSSCPDAYESFDAKSIAQDAADGGWTSFAIGLQAADETSAYPWKKFKAETSSAPKLTINYNRKPKLPSSVKQSPGSTGCDLTSPYQRIGKRTLVLSAHSSDPDDTSTKQDLKYLDFELWHTGDGDNKILDKNATVDSDGDASASVSYTKFVTGYTYSWRVRAIDASGAASSYYPTKDPAVCRFIYDADAPNEPIVTSPDTDFPAADEDGTIWSAKRFGTTGTFKFAPGVGEDDNGNEVTDADITQFWWSWNSTSYANHVTVAATKSYSASTFAPPSAGPNVLYVKAIDSAGNPSLGTKYVFYVTPKDAADKAGDVTGDAKPDLFAITSGGNLMLYPSNDLDTAGDLHMGMYAAHNKGTVLVGSDDYNAYWVQSHWVDGGSSTVPALIAHGADAYPGDGTGDLFARMPDGKLYLYPGDGYGSVDISRRISVRLPSGSPDPADFDQIIVADYNVDGRPDLFATTTAGAFWAFSGYTGATFATASKMATTAWAARDLVSVGDHNADGEPDLLWRTGATSGNLYIRYGKPDTTNGGSTIASLAAAADSLTGADTVYATGWTMAAVPVTHLYGTPDVTGDAIPDIWALASDGTIKIYAGGSAAIGSGTAVISADSEWATTKLTFG